MGLARVGSRGGGTSRLFVVNIYPGPGPLYDLSGATGVIGVAEVNGMWPVALRQQATICASCRIVLGGQQHGHTTHVSDLRDTLDSKAELYPGNTGCTSGLEKVIVEEMPADRLNFWHQATIRVLWCTVLGGQHGVRGHGCDILGHRTAGGCASDRTGNPTDKNEPGFGTGAVPVVCLCTPSGSVFKLGQETAGPNKTGTCHGSGGTSEGVPDVFSSNFWQLEREPDIISYNFWPLEQEQWRSATTPTGSLNNKAKVCRHHSRSPVAELWRRRTPT